VSNRNPSPKTDFPLWFTIYMLLVGALIGLVIASMTGLEQVKCAGLLFGSGFFAMYSYYSAYRKRPEAFGQWMLFSLAVSLFCANVLVSVWFPRLNLSLLFVYYMYLSAILLMFVAALYPTIHRWCRARPSADG
jgi:cellulose synthase/poly-beta-1,6-N-acetylglucosamine synthase-like glycosyltransferase